MAILCQEVAIGTNAQHHPSAHVFLLSILLYCSLIMVQVLAVQDLERASCDGIDLFLNEDYAGSHALLDSLSHLIDMREKRLVAKNVSSYIQALHDLR